MVSARRLFSESWHAVAALRPRLSSHARLHRHVYRGKVWYVVQDQSGGRYHRLTPPAYQLLCRMDGRQTVQALWQQANTEDALDACTQQDLVDLLVHLHASELLQVDVTPDSAALFHRYRKKKIDQIKQWLINPMSIKVALFNPDAFLRHLAPSCRWLFSAKGILLWLLVVLPALFFALQHWQELTHNFSDNVLSSGNLLVMACVYPVVKLLHEMGHGVATRIWGGPVPQAGLMFLVFAPVPYVDASAAAAFPSRYRRAVVGAAGMLVEVFIAALAMYVWLLVEPGVVRAVAFNTMLIAGISTLVVNGNPLLKYDAYFMLCDLVEIPNLAQRGQQYLTFLWDKHVFGAADAPCPDESPSEKKWLLGYTPLSWCYRTLLTISIILFMADQFFFFGVLLALWGLLTLIAVPLWKAWKHVSEAAVLQRQRRRALRISMALVAALLVLLGLVPMPLYTQAQGVVWLPEQSLLHAGGEGFFVRWLLPPGSRVHKGDALYVLENPLLETELRVSQAQVDLSQALYTAQQFTDPVKASVLLQDLQRDHKRLQHAQEQVYRLTGYAEAEGVLQAPQAGDMPGKFYRKGDLLGHVLNAEQLLARIVVQQDDIHLVRTRLQVARMRLADSLAKVYDVRMVRFMPGAVNELPTAALGLNGGGVIATAPDDGRGLKTLERVFMVDMALPVDARSRAFGARVYVRFDHGYESAAEQAIRRLRQLLLSRFNV